MPAHPSTFRIALIGFVSLALAMGIGRFAFTPLLPMMRDDGLVTIADGGLLASVHFLGYWLGALCAAKVPAPPKRLFQLSLLVIALGTLGMGVTDSFAAWLIWRWLAGVCSAWTLILVGNYYVRHLAEHGRAEKQGWIFSGVGAGIAVAGLACLAFMASGTASAPSWRILGAVSLLTACALCFAVGPETPAVRPATGRAGSRRWPLDWRIVLAYGAMGIGYIIPATYLPVMAQEAVPSPLIFGWSWPVFGAAAFVSTILAPRLNGWASNRQVWATSQIVMAVGLLLPVVLPHIVAIVAAGLCVGGSFMIITMAGIKEVHRTVPAHDVLRHIAVMTAAFATGQMVGPVFASSIYALTQEFAVSLVVTSAVLAVTALGLMNGLVRQDILQP